MDATQQIEDSFFGEEDDSGDEHDLAEEKSQREPLAVLKVFKNNHIPETEVPLYQGENILGRDPTSCSVPLQACSISGCHAIISISVFGPNDRRGHSEETEALLWDLGSLNGTRKARLKLNPHVRYALTDGDTVVLADLPCQYVSLKNTERNTHTSTDGKTKRPTSSSSSAEGGTEKRAENGRKKSALPPVPVWGDEEKRLQPLQTSPKQPETTLVPESDSDSDGEKHGRRERRRIVVSDSASSDLSSPTCSTFLTPANKIIPESEDESSITPSPALKGRFQKTGNDTEVSSDSFKPDPLHFNIDSDTDVEDDDVGMMKATPAVEAAVTAEVAAVNPADLHMDSDTDVEEEDVEKVKTDPEAPAKQDLVNPAALTMDSDTDVEENEPVKTDTASLSGPADALEEKKDAASSAQFHLENDTDVEDEDVPHIQDSRPTSSHVAEFNINSDTDVEEDEETTKAIEPACDNDSKHLVKQAVDFPDVKTLHHESGSDTDVEDDVNKIRTPTVAEETGMEFQIAGEGSTDTQHDSPVQIQPPADAQRDVFRLDSDTDVEEDEDETQEKEQKCAKGAVQIVQSSTPIGAGLSEEEKETQAFLSPSHLFKRPGLPSVLHPSVSPGGVSHTDDDFAVAETQSFVCDAARTDATLDETPQSLDDPEPQRSDGAPSFQLDLSDSSHQPAEAEEHNQEPGEDWQLQATQLYAMKNSEGSTKAGQTQLDLDATQAYTDSISQEEVEDEGKDEEEDVTQPLAAPCHSTIHTAETQLIKPGAQNEDPSDRESNEKVGASEPERKEEEEVHDEMQADSHLSTADTLLIVRSPRQEEQTQPYASLVEVIQKERESKDEEGDEGQRAQNETNESMGQDNDGREFKGNERMLIETKNGVTGDSVEDEKKERDENQRGGNDNGVDEAQTQPAEADTIIETLPMCEEEEEKGHEDEPSSSRGTQSAQATQCIESDHHTHTALAIAETLPFCEEEEEKGHEEEHEDEPSSSRGTQSAQATQRIESDHHTHTALAIAETLPFCEEEEEKGHEEEHEDEPSSSRGAQSAQATQRIESDHHTHAALAIAETLPMCEEEEGQEEEENELKKNWRQNEEAPKHSVESDKVSCMTVAETLPMCEEDNEGQEEEEARQSEVMSIKRSSRRRRNPKTKPVTGHVAIPETLPLCDEEEGQEEKPQSEVKPIRKSHRVRQTSKVEATQPLEADSTAEAMKTEEEEQDTRRSLRGKRGRATSGKVKGRGRAAAEKDRIGKRGKVEQDKDSDEELDGGNKGRGRKNLRQKSKDDDKARLEEKNEEEARDQLEREESIRLEKEREESEKQEKEEKDRLERERKEREEKQQCEREMKEKEEKERAEMEKQLEKERVEREKQLEKERREQEEKDRLEQERVERENKEKEEKEKLEKETRDRRELEEKLERERKEQEEKDRLEREKREREEKEQRKEKEKQGGGEEQKESKDNNEGMEKEKRQAPGRRKAERKGKKSKKEEEQELEEGTEERLDSEQQKKECEESSSKKQADEQAESDSKPRQSRRTARKSLAPPADMVDEGGPAKRTRSRSNSSNSVCSEQSTQDSLSEGSRRGRRRTITAPSSEKEDTKQAVHSCSNSRSSGRSSDSMATQSQGRGAKRRKSVKAEEQEEKVEERKQSAAVGRGRGGKRPGANDIKAEAACEAEEAVPAEDSVTSQSSSRGRKRGADVSMSETPQPTPKTPRRSLTGPTPKVLFTGVMDEDGEKVVMRLGGGMAKGVADMTHLVTDKVRRTVKFLCAVARGVPIVTPDWLSKCGKAGSFLSPNGFIVKDVEQEKRFNFSLQDALRVASSQPLLKGYEIHVTPSVKPEPAQMKEIITCCGARFLPKMPSALKAQTVVVVSCEEDRALCERARSLSFPVVSAEFLLTGILQQKVDLQTHSLSLSPAAAAPKPNACRRGK